MQSPPSAAPWEQYDLVYQHQMLHRRQMLGELPRSPAGPWPSWPEQVGFDALTGILWFRFSPSQMHGAQYSQQAVPVSRLEAAIQRSLMERVVRPGMPPAPELRLLENLQRGIIFAEEEEQQQQQYLAQQQQQQQQQQHQQHQHQQQQQQQQQQLQQQQQSLMAQQAADMRGGMSPLALPTSGGTTSGGAVAWSPSMTAGQFSVAPGFFPEEVISSGAVGGVGESGGVGRVIGDIAGGSRVVDAALTSPVLPSANVKRKYKKRKHAETKHDKKHKHKKRGKEEKKEKTEKSVKSKDKSKSKSKAKSKKIKDKDKQKAKESKQKAKDKAKDKVREPKDRAFDKDKVAAERVVFMGKDKAKVTDKDMEQNRSKRHKPPPTTEQKPSPLFEQAAVRQRTSSLPLFPEDPRFVDLGQFRQRLAAVASHGEELPPRSAAELRALLSSERSDTDALGLLRALPLSSGVVGPPPDFTRTTLLDRTVDAPAPGSLFADRGEVNFFALARSQFQLALLKQRAHSEGEAARARIARLREYGLAQSIAIDGLSRKIATADYKMAEQRSRYGEVGSNFCVLARWLEGGEGGIKLVER